jgi:uncharacterized protein (TIGR02271 family)
MRRFNVRVTPSGATFGCSNGRVWTVRAWFVIPRHAASVACFATFMVEMEFVMRSHDLVAFYSNQPSAEHVRDDLLAGGFGRDDVKVFGNDGKQSGGGVWDSIKGAFGYLDDEDRALYAEATRRGASAVAVSLDDGDGASGQTARRIMQKYSPIDVDAQSNQWRTQGWTGAQQQQQHAQPQQHATAPMQTNRTAPATQANAQAIPVVREELRIGKRRVEAGGIRVYSHVTSKPVEEEVRLREEHVSVQRRPADRPVTNEDQAFKERAIEATEMREEAVVDKRARVVEEVLVNKQASERTETVRDKVRSTDVEVQKIPAGQTRTDATYDEFSNSLASDSRYRGRSWDSLEPEFRRNFEQRYPGSRWEQAKDAVHHGYDRACAKS